MPMWSSLIPPRDTYVESYACLQQSKGQKEPAGDEFQIPWVIKHQTRNFVHIRMKYPCLDEWAVCMQVVVRRSVDKQTNQASKHHTYLRLSMPTIMYLVLVTRYPAFPTNKTSYYSHMPSPTACTMTDSCTYLHTDKEIQHTDIEIWKQILYNE